jgi:predicted deacylase
MQLLITKRILATMRWVHLVVIALLSVLVPTFVADAAESQSDNDSSTGSAEGNGARQVVSMLDVSSLQAGKHEFHFFAGTDDQGATMLVPVVVVKGRKPGKRLLVTAGVHGDELNGIGVIQSLIADLADRELSGTVIAVPGLNQPGLAANSRYFAQSTNGKGRRDLNRVFPGKLDSSSEAARYAGKLWQGLLSNNADIAVDLHTQTTGSSYPLFVFADFRDARAKQMAFELQPEMIKNDRGQKGTLETAFLAAGIPAVTYEIGAPQKFQQDLIARAVQGLKNLMKTEGILRGAPQVPDNPSYVGSMFSDIHAASAGVFELKIQLLDDVVGGQLIAIGYDAYGVETKRYFAPKSGRIVSVATGTEREAGNLLARILY